MSKLTWIARLYNNLGLRLIRRIRYMKMPIPPNFADKQCRCQDIDCGILLAVCIWYHSRELDLFSVR